MNPQIKLHNCDNLELMKTLPDESLDVICIDPPYLYLKNQKLERAFDEQLFFSECKRLLTKSGFIVMFGRGTSFYRWNTMLDELGMTFKEEIIWNKSHCTSPLMAVSRVHETISLYCKGNGKINRCKVPYLEMKGHDIPAIVTDIKRLKTAFGNTKSLDAVMGFLENQSVVNATERKHRTSVSVQPSELTNKNRSAAVMQIIQEGMNEKSIIPYRDTSDCWNANYLSISSSITKENRCVSVVRSIHDGLNEKTIIKEVRDHYSAIHPTQKPVRLLERLLALVIPQDKPVNKIVVADFFAGSMSCMEAVHKMGMQGIACEIDKEYFEDGKSRVENLTKEPKQAEMFA